VAVLAGVSLPVGAQVLPRIPGQLSVTADRQEADTRTGDVIARGRVRIVYPARKLVATADQAVYSPRQKTLVLTGNVHAVQEENRLDAEVLTYQLDRGTVRAEPATGQQVTSVYQVPEEEDTPQPTVGSR
jgi:lipopolysaccharide export system protein LptA